MYSPDWIIKNMGISKKTLRVYEEKGFLHPIKNSETGFREYSDEDLKSIWHIKLFVSLGYSFKEIEELGYKGEEFIVNSLDKKIQKMEFDKLLLDKKIAMAEMVKLTGRIPDVPSDEMGNIKFNDFFRQALEEWTILSSPRMSALYKMMQTDVYGRECEYTDEEINGLAELENYIDMETLIELSTSFEELSKLFGEDILSNTVQKKVGMIYEYCEKLCQNTSGKETAEKLLEKYMNTFVDGEVAISNEQRFGKDVCDFVAGAIQSFLLQKNVVNDK